MNRTKLKNYAPQARRDFIQAISDRAVLFGLPAKDSDSVIEQGDVAIINGHAFPRVIVAKRQKLIERIKLNGFAPTMEAVAYTWFNRFVAIRFMELHGYLDHGYRVLSHPDGKDIPEILLYAEHVELPGLNRDKVIELKLDGTKEAELYRLLLVAQCNALNAAMPFLFERVDDETELLLPDNLLHSDSLIRKLVREIDEEDWKGNVEIIGWLYQFYISERKDEVIGKVVRSEDIPAATQLFTPNWIVKYLVQNSIGRMWLQTYPDSTLRAKVDYYIEPAEQTPEVQAQLAAITPAAIDPETITVLDPACGSGHILVEAYDLLKEIYLERGYRLRDIPRLILSKNLFGLDIDDRAAQLSSFALLMKARADDRRIFDTATRGQSDAANESAIRNPQSAIVNVLTIPDSSALSLRPHQLAETLFSDEARRGAIPIRASNVLFGEMETQPSLLMVDESINPKSAIRNPQSTITEQHIIELLECFEMGKTLGSLIRLPADYGTTLAAIAELIADKSANGDIYEKIAARQIEPFVRAAEILHAKYDCVIANPPYLGSKGMNSAVKDFAKRQFPDSKSDLFAMFIDRVMEMIRPNGEAGFVTPFVWMFISSYEKFRSNLIRENVISSLIQLEYNAFEPACVPVCAFTIEKGAKQNHKGEFIKLSDFKGHQNQAPRTLEAIENPACGWRFQASTDDFKKIPGSPIAYWVNGKIREIFSKGNRIDITAKVREGMHTGDNAAYLRIWFEISASKFSTTETSYKSIAHNKKKWIPFNKGGAFRKWYGNNETVLSFDSDSREKMNKVKGHVRPSQSLYFKPSVTWSYISSTYFGVRRSDSGFIFGNAGSCVFPPDAKLNLITGFLCSILTNKLLMILSPTMNFMAGTVASLPIIESKLYGIELQVSTIVEEAVAMARADWDSFEISWDFQTFPLIRQDLKAATVEQSFLNWQTLCQANIQRMQELETENNRLFIEAYGLQDELSPDVPAEQITLARADREADIRRLVSYAVGCVMGRYSLDHPGLVYAESGNIGFDPAKYQTFPADADGIVPVTEIEWFADDAANRFFEFIGKAWPAEGLEENLRFIAESLGANRNEETRDTVRRYFAAGFFKDHLQRYKKRPIYWLFSSGKQRAFQCLVYLHRYHEGMLARMRTEYVIPLQGKIAARIRQLEDDKLAATSTSHRRKLEKEQDTLKKQQIELIAFDEKLRHYADQRITLDLDDGVKVNYGKFGDLLAEVKAVTGGSED